MGERIEIEVEGGAQPTGGGRGGGFSILLMIPGLGFVVLGVLVLIVPQLLEILVATALILVGLGFVFGALRVRRAERRFASLGGPFSAGPR